MISYNEITSLFVSPLGGSETSGTERGPCASGSPFPSLRSAFEFVKELRRSGICQPISIRLADGLYCLDSTLLLGPGLNGITVEPDRGGNARIIGGVKIDGWRWDEYNGAKCLSAPVCGLSDFSDFFVNGRRARMTRYPENGWLYAEDVENRSLEPFSSSKWFIAREGDFRDFRNIDRIQISFCHFWVDEHTPIESYDRESRRVSLLYRSRFSIAGGEGTPSRLEYCLENVAEAFGRADDWYRDGDRIYYVPRDDSVTPETIEALVPQISKLFQIEGTPEDPAKNIRFRGIIMGITRGEYGPSGFYNGEEVKFASDAQAVSLADGAVSFSYAENCSFEDCEMENFGLHGFVVKEGCHGIRIRRTLIRGGGAGGIVISGGKIDTPECEHTFGNTVEDCTITQCGQRYFAACGILLKHSYENNVSHNEISHLYYSGISAGWVWGYSPSISRDNRIEKNHIHHLGNGMLSDMGGVYLLGIQPGTVVSGNVIHDIRSRNYGGWALYTDEGSSFITLENNICYNCSDNAFHQHYGSMNTVRNNIFAFSGEQVICVTRSEPHLSVIFENNIICANGVPVYDISRDQINQKTVSSIRNLIYDISGREPVLCVFHEKGKEKALYLADLQAAGCEHESMTADPLFEDAEHFDFRLRPGSPAIELGFRPIESADAGPRFLSGSVH
ncbi:MAG: right-handed parallel beta-helix repeat-containing protein [Clostridia bacterium]|nr:right-handed parallel beta-helix repeat-containing protein [Clostridia bacterium]